MGTGIETSLHLAVHLLGFTVAVGLTTYALSRRGQGGAEWTGLTVGGVLLAVSHVAMGGLFSGGGIWPLYARVAGYAALALGAAGGVSAAPVVVALGPVGVHLAAAVAAVMAAVASARGVLGRGRDVLALAAGLVLWGGSDLVVRESATAAGLLSIVGSVAVGWWLVRRTHGSLLARYVSYSSTLLLTLAVGLAAASGVVFISDIERSELEELDRLAESQERTFTGTWPSDLLTNARAVSGDRLASELRSVADGGSPLDPLAEAVTSFSQSLDVAVLVTAEGDVVGSWDEARDGPMSRADEAAVGGDEKLRRALAGERVEGLLQLGEQDLLAVGVAPVREADPPPQLDPQAGALLIGRRITEDDVVAEIQDQTTASEAAIVVGGTVASSTLGAEADRDVLDVTGISERPRVETVAGARRFLAVAPITQEGVRIGSVVLMRDPGAIANIEGPFTRRLFLVTIAGLVFTVLLAAYAASRTAQPVRRLTDAATRISEGDLSVRTAVDREDEVGRLSAAFDHMTEVLDAREDELREAAAVEARLRSRLEIVTSSMGEALLATDEDGRVTTANPAAAELLRRSREELVERPVEEVLPGTDGLGGSLVEALEGTAGGGPVAVRGAVRSDGQHVPVAASAAPLTGRGGEHLGRVYVLRDITGQVEVERMKSEFLANVSHELRTPLTPIKGYAEVLRTKQVSHDRAVEFATTIAESAARLERVIEMLVDFAALEAGRMGLELEPTQPDRLVARVLETWRERRPERRFEGDIESGLPMVQVDPDRMERILEEVVDNAVKFSDGPVRIAVRRHGPDRIRLSVDDQGVGIPPHRLQAIRGDFHQADGSSTRSVGGLGLGLSIVSRILERFHGDLEIESTLGEGTRVHLLLPVDGT